MLTPAQLLPTLQTHRGTEVHKALRHEEPANAHGSQTLPARAGAIFPTQSLTKPSKGPWWLSTASQGPLSRLSRRENTAEREERLWIEAVREGKEPLTKPEEAFVITKILEGIYTSAKTGTIYHFN